MSERYNDAETCRDVRYVLLFVVRIGSHVYQYIHNQTDIFFRLLIFFSGFVDFLMLPYTYTIDIFFLLFLCAICVCVCILVCILVFCLPYTRIYSAFLLPFVCIVDVCMCAC